MRSKDWAAQISYLLFVVTLASVVWLGLGTFLVTALFGSLALRAFSFHRSKPLSVMLYSLAVIVIGAGLLYIASLAYRTLPEIAESSIPAMAEFAEKNGIELPFTSYASLKGSALAQAREGIAIIGRYARIASYQSVLLLAGLVVALSVFLNPSWTAGVREATECETIYSRLTRELGIRFNNLYRSFAKVIGAQIVIAGINAGLTTIFLFVCGYPNSVLLIGMVFLCGLIPIVGNLMSNVVIVGVGFTISPTTGILALTFLVVIHKLEYILDSKIIGRRIDCPMWLTLIGLLVGERLMGISGMILAPVVLHCVRIELSAFEARSAWVHRACL